MSKLAFTFVAASLLAPLAAHADGGSIEGTVEAKPAKFLADSIVYVKKVDGAKTAPKTVDVDQKGLQFTPHIVLLAAGDSVAFHNGDNVDHNVTSPEGKYDLGNWGQGKSKTQAFPKEGVFSQVCKIHPEMLSYVFVGQNRFAAVVDGSGKFSITGVPAGSYEVDIWNPKLKAAPVTVKVEAGKAADAKFALAR